MNEIVVGAAAVLALFLLPRQGRASIGSPNDPLGPRLDFGTSPAWRRAPDQLPNETARLSRYAQPSVDTSGCTCITAPCNCGPVDTSIRAQNSVPIYSASDPVYQTWTPAPQPDPEPYGLAVAPWNPVFSNTVEGNSWFGY